MAEERVPRRLSAILALDMVGFSRLMEENDNGTLLRLNAARTDVIDPELADNFGRLVKTTGDGFLFEFKSAVDAVSFALAVQRKFSERESDLPEDLRLCFRTGVNLGDVIIDGDDIFGDGVNIASRLEGICEPGGVLISGSVKEQIDGKIEANFIPGGERSLKNISRPVSVWSWAVDAEASFGVDRTRPVLSLPDKPSVAVLPFTDMGGHPDNTFFADGITEDIITELSRLSGFFVIARNTTFVYKGRSVDVKRLGRDLGVRYVLEGSVRRFEDRIRVNAQLIDATSGNHLWADRYDGASSDIFSIQDQITESVIGCVAPELYAAENERSRRKPPQNLDAWECWVQALFYCAQQSKQSTEKSLELIDLAIKLDPGYAPPFGLKAWIQVWRAFQGWQPMESAIKSATDNISIAHGLEGDEVWALLAQAMVGFAVHDNNLSLSSAERALRANPNMAFAHGMLSIAHAFGGRPEPALESVAHALRLSPREMFTEDYHLFQAFSYFAASQYQRCLQSAQISHRGRPHHPYPIIMSLVAAGLLEDNMMAQRNCDKLLALVPGATISRLTETCPFCLQEDIDKFEEGLRKANFPTT